MLDNIIHSPTGLVHTLLAILALICGTIIVLSSKGTKGHIRTGYVYVFAMLAMNITSFFLDNFNGFSLFHFIAIISLMTLLAGLIPTLLKTKNWFPYHFYFMSWSVVGLYCGLWAEIGVRFTSSMTQFWWVVGLAGTLTSAIGGLIIYRQGKKLNL